MGTRFMQSLNMCKHRSQAWPGAQRLGSSPWSCMPYILLSLKTRSKEMTYPALHSVGSSKARLRQGAGKEERQDEKRDTQRVRASLLSGMYPLGQCLPCLTSVKYPAGLSQPLTLPSSVLPERPPMSYVFSCPFHWTTRPGEELQLDQNVCGLSPSLAQAAWRECSPHKGTFIFSMTELVDGAELSWDGSEHRHTEPGQSSPERAGEAGYMTY